MPAGPFFRRPGPAAWTGRPVTSAMRLGGYADADAGDEEITVTYDRDGFRNPEDLRDWEIAVVGDSFTEAGTVTQDELYTTILGRELGQRVRNLGVSFTGPLSQTYFLQHFGKAPSAKHAVLAFFEGNDLQDLQREVKLREAYHAGQVVKAPSRLDELPPQSSFVRAVGTWLGLLLSRSEKPKPPELVNGEFVGGAAPVPMTLDFIPPSSSDVSPALRESLDRALGGFAQTAREQGMKPWLLYIPSKRRALDGRLRFLPSATPEMAGWKPTDLPQWVAGLAEAHGITVVDATPALAAEAQRGVLPYNAIFDTHLNPAGHRAVAKTLADAMRDAPAP